MTEETKELKIVVTHKGGEGCVGIQFTDCDPVFFTVPGDLPVVFAELPKCLADADAIWQVNPRYKTAKLPDPLKTPAATTTPAKQQTVASSPPKPAAAKKTEGMSAMF